MITLAREAAGLTQRDLAALMGISQPSLARLERGRYEPTADDLRALIRHTRMLEIFFLQYPTIQLGPSRLFMCRCS